MRKRGWLSLGLSLLVFWLYSCTPTESVSFDLELGEPLELMQGQESTFRVDLSRNGVSSMITVELVDPPEGLESESINIMGNSDSISIAASSSMEPGTYTLTFKASSASPRLEKTISTSLVVMEASEASLTLKSLPDTLELEPGETKSIVVRVERLLFNGDISISVSGLPAGVSVAPLSLAANETTGVLSFQAEDDVEVTSSQLTVSAKGGTLEDTVSLTLSILETNGFLKRFESPASVYLLDGSSSALPVTIERSASFSEAVLVEATVPEGITASSLVLAPNETSGVLTLVAASNMTFTDELITLRASAGDNGLTRTVSLSSIATEERATNLEIPWDLVEAPNGDIYFGERAGQFYRLSGSTLQALSSPLSVYQTQSSGLLGLVLHPNFTATNYLYACYSYIKVGGENPIVGNRISRLTVQGNALVDEFIVVDDIPGSPGHNGCRLAISPDNKLFATTGDAYNREDSQDTDILSGKVLRVNLDGSIPSDNPFDNEVWTFGHRNAQGLTFHPNGKLYSTEHGDIIEDEINLIEKGRNYGWPNVEGFCDGDEIAFCTANNVREPLLSYTPTLAVAGMTVYEGDMFPDWQGDLFFVSLKEGQLNRLELSSDGESIVRDSVIVDYSFGRLRDVTVLEDGSLLLATSNQQELARPPYPLEKDDKLIRLYTP